MSPMIGALDPSVIACLSPYINALAAVTSAFVLGGFAKFWLDPIGLAINHGFPEPELNDIERLVRQHEQTLRQAWHEYFDS